MEYPLAKLYQACDPMAPATAEQYVDTSEARGQHAIARRFQNALDNASGGKEFQKLLLTGHIGGGKSSELLHLKDLLEAESKYFVVFVDARDYVDEHDVTPNDVLLACVSELADHARLVGVSLQDSYFTQKVQEARSLLTREVDIDDVEVSGGLLKTKVKLLKQDSSVRDAVRKALTANEGGFLSQVNLVFDEARLELRKKKRGELVLIIDGLDRVVRVGGQPEGMPSQKHLIIDNARKFVELACHTILTVSLGLSQSNCGALRLAYGVAPATLPMIKVRDREGSKYDLGYELLSEVLKKRGVNSELVDKDALDSLIQYSGGHIRDLLSMVREAITSSNTGRLDLASANAAIGLFVRSMNVSRTQWTRLAELERDPDHKLAPEDPISSNLLEQLFALEYVNGGVAHSQFEEDDPWYAVHPILRELRSFKTAIKDYDSLHSKS